MRISGVNAANFGKIRLFKRTSKEPLNKNEENPPQKGGIYVKPVSATKSQEDTISRALGELQKVQFSANDIIYMQNLGVNLQFRSGMEAVEFLRQENIDVTYAEFSNPSVHACLDTTGSKPLVLINSEYRDLASFADILALSEAIMHEASHAKDGDSINSIQEEIDCLAANVLAHQYHKHAYPGIYENKNSPLFKEGVSLYSALFFDFDPKKAALKNRIADKYGFLDVSSPGHDATKGAIEIKQISK